MEPLIKGGANHDKLDEADALELGMQIPLSLIKLRDFVFILHRQMSDRVLNLCVLNNRTVSAWNGLGGDRARPARFAYPW